FRPSYATGSKYAILSPFEQVHSFPEGEPLDPEWFLRRLGRKPLCPTAAQAIDCLENHWNAIAVCIDRRGSRPEPAATASLLWQALPHALARQATRQAAALEALRREGDAMRQQLHDAAMTERDRRIEQLTRDLAICDASICELSGRAGEAEQALA